MTLPMLTMLAGIVQAIHDFVSVLHRDTLDLVVAVIEDVAED